MRHRLYFSFTFIPDHFAFHTSILFLPLSLTCSSHIALPFVVVVDRFNATYPLPLASSPPLPACARRGKLRPSLHHASPPKLITSAFPVGVYYLFFSFLLSPSFPTSPDPCLPTSSSGEIFSLLRRSILSNKKGFTFSVVIHSLPPQLLFSPFHLFILSFLHSLLPRSTRRYTLNLTLEQILCL